MITADSTIEQRLCGQICRCCRGRRQNRPRVADIHLTLASWGQPAATELTERA